MLFCFCDAAVSVNVETVIVVCGASGIITESIWTGNVTLDFESVDSIVTFLLSQNKCTLDSIVL